MPHSSICGLLFTTWSSWQWRYIYEQIWKLFPMAHGNMAGVIYCFLLSVSYNCRTFMLYNVLFLDYIFLNDNSSLYTQKSSVQFWSSKLQTCVISGTVPFESYCTFPMLLLCVFWCSCVFPFSIFLSPKMCLKFSGRHSSANICFTVHLHCLIIRFV